MARHFGNRATFAVEVGEKQSQALRVVDLWAGGKWLTTDDNSAFVPYFSRAMRSSAARVRHREIKPCPYPGRTPQDVFALLHADKTELREQFWFLQWGETVDNVSIYAYMEDDHLVIVFAFWRTNHPFPQDLGKTFFTRLSPEEFAATVEEAADLLDAERTA